MYRLLSAAVGAALVATPLIVAFAPAPAEAQLRPRARVWVENERDHFRAGERLRVHFTSSQDAHVAVVHISTDGRLDFLYPANPWDDGYVRGGRVYSAHQGGFSALAVGSRPGIGYLYVIASEAPLDFGHFGGAYARGWDWSFAGRSVRGDPYLALEQITRMLLPDWGANLYSVDYYSYHVGGRHQYPSYACGSTGWGVHRGWGWTANYGSCSRLIVFLREYPGYYDTHVYRGDRRVYLRGQELPDLRHGYKASPLGGSRGGYSTTRDDAPRGRTVAPGAVPTRQGSRPQQPERRRPTLERRGAGSGGSAPAARPPARSGSAGGATKAAPSPSARPGSSGGQKQSAPRPARRRGGGGESEPATTAPRRRGGGGGGTAENPPAL